MNAPSSFCQRPWQPFVKLKPALFLDRDGVINVDIGHAHKIEHIIFLPGIFELVIRANRLGYAVLIVTNQAGIGKGLYTVSEFEFLMHWIIAEFKSRGAIIDDFAYCPHHPQAITPALRLDCRCRKPRSGMIFDLALKHQINLAQSVFIGDRHTDVIAANGASVPEVYLFNNPEEIDFLTDDLQNLVKPISTFDCVLKTN